MICKNVDVVAVIILLLGLAAFSGLRATPLAVRIAHRHVKVVNGMIRVASVRVIPFERVDLN